MASLSLVESKYSTLDLISWEFSSIEGTKDESQGGREDIFGYLWGDI